MKAPATSGPVLKFSLCSLSERVDFAGRAIRYFMKGNGLSVDAFKVELLARECLNNAITHGNKLKESKRARLELMIGQKWIHLRVTDCGSGYNWQKTIGATRLSGNAISGRGLSIVKQYANRVCFNRRGNQIALWIKKGKGDNSQNHGKLHN
jgi:anti-sigma regulatory factor (Ser/Thr protein kinase)